MGNAPPNRITVWQLVPTGDSSRRFSLSSDYIILEHNHVDGRRVIKINDEEMVSMCVHVTGLGVVW